MSKPGNRFVYQRIASSLQQKIKNGKFPTGKLPPERFLAEYYGVNRLTMRKAMDILEEAKWIYRLGRKGTFIGRRSGEYQIPGRRIFAFLHVGQNFWEPFGPDAFMVLERTLRDSGANLLFFNVSSPDEIRGLKVFTGKGMVDGIFVAGTITAGVIKELQNTGIPLVALGYLQYRDPIEETIDRVLFDSMEYGYVATKFLIDRGFQKISLINGPSNQFFLGITQGYMKALDETGVSFEEQEVITCKDSASEAHDELLDWLENNTPEACFVANERIFNGFFRALQKSGHDEANMAFVTGLARDDDLCSEFNILKIPVQEMADKAVEMMFNRINNAEAPPSCGFVKPVFSF
jgi:DNA-binding LacI/PurR family transcriptional regulator